MPKSSPKTVIAIDPGASGGIAIHGTAIYCKPMPKAVTDLMEFLRGFKDDGEVTVVMEEVPKFIAGMQTSASAMATLHANVGYIKGVVDTLGYKLVTMKPKKWQALVDAGEKKNYGNKWKAHLKDLALRSFPFLGKAVTLKTADALLILLAYFAQHNPALEKMKCL